MKNIIKKRNNKNSAEKIKAIAFDVGGVLSLRKNSSKNFSAHLEISKKLGISLDTWMDAIDSTFAKSIEGKISKQELLEIFSKNLKVPKKKIEKIIHEVHKKNYKFNEQLFKRAYELKKQGYKIAILSDQWPLAKDVLVPKDTYKKFDAVIISCDVKTRKPKKDIYQLLIKKLKLKPSEILFIDNRHWNTEPAEKLGMKTIIFENNKQLCKHPLWENLPKK